MTPDQLASRVADLANALRLELRREIETVATTGQAMVIDRVSETGKDSRGVAFKPYTPEWEAKKRQAVGGKASAKKRKERATAPATPEKTSRSCTSRACRGGPTGPAHRHSARRTAGTDVGAGRRRWRVSSQAKTG